MMNYKASSTLVVYGELLLTMILWGIAWPVGRLLATGLPPVSIATIRYAIVVPVFLVILRLRERSVRISRSWIGTFIVLGLLNTTLYQSLLSIRSKLCSR